MGRQRRRRWGRQGVQSIVSTVALLGVSATADLWRVVAVVFSQGKSGREPRRGKELHRDLLGRWIFTAEVAGGYEGDMTGVGG